MTKILTIGTATYDVFIKSGVFKKLPFTKEFFDKKLGQKAQCVPIGEKLEIEEPIFSIGGGAYNSAVTFSRAGFKTYSIFEIGNDFFGKKILEGAKKEKIIPLDVVNKKGSTGISFIFINEKGEKTIFVSRGVSSDLYDDDISKMIPDGVNWVYVATGNLPISFLNKLLGFLREKKVKIALSPSKGFLRFGILKTKNIFDKCNVVILNKEEASILTKTPSSQKKKIFKTLDKFVNGIVIMTDGKKGASASDGKTLFECEIFEDRKTVNETGAGDAFGSGFVAGLIEFNGKNAEEKIKYALRRASANAASVVEHIGANVGILRKKEFLANKRWRKLEISARKI